MIIGISYTGTDEKQQYYTDWLKASPAKPEIITLSAEPKQNKGSLADCHALVLSGGIDVHPGYYNSDNLVYPNKPEAFQEKRDAFERSLYREAQKRTLPVLAICRGMQLVNSLEGGTLQQDLGARNTVHKAVIDPEKKQFDKAHGVHVTPRTLLARTGVTRSVVNSAHHQCVQNLAPTLVSNCVSDDQVIEGLEWAAPAGKGFLLAVQWHPERMHQFQLNEMALSAGIRELFIDAITNSLRK